MVGVTKLEAEIETQECSMVFIYIRLAIKLDNLTSKEQICIYLTQMDDRRLSFGRPCVERSTNLARPERNLIAERRRCCFGRSTGQANQLVLRREFTSSLLCLTCTKGRVISNSRLTFYGRIDLFVRTTDHFGTANPRTDRYHSHFEKFEK